MGKANRKFMQIPKEYLEEKNYSGTRLVEVTDETILKLKAEIKAFQKEAMPFLKIMDELTPEMDSYYTEIRELETKKKEIQEKVAPIKAEYDIPLAEVEKIDNKATLIKNKLQPLVMNYVSEQLGEFEKAMQLIEQDGKIFIEVVDEIEEKIKAIRVANSKK